MTTADRPCCSVGARLDVGAIDEALRLVGQPGAESLSALAARVGINKGSLHRHRAHLESGVAEGQQRVATDSATSEQQAETRHITPATPYPTDDRPTAPRKVISATIEERCVDLRIAGKTYRQIAAELDIDRETAIDAVERVLVRTIGRADRKAEHAREIEVRRCEAIIAAFWDEATGDKSEGQGRAADRVLRASERKAKLLGLDVPTNGVGQMPFYLAPGFDEFLGVMLGSLQDKPETLAEVLDAIRGHIAMLAAQKPARPGLRLVSGGKAS